MLSRNLSMMGGWDGKRHSKKGILRTMENL